MKINIIYFSFFLLLLGSCSKSERYVLDLSGKWSFSVDSSDCGIAEQWFGKKLSDTIHLPGSMAENGKGQNVSIRTHWLGTINDSSWFKSPKYAKYRTDANCKVPFWLTPAKYYAGAAWYQKEIEVPESWNGRYIELFLERCHWETQVWLDGSEIGRNNSLSVPHRYNLSAIAKPGKHRLTIRVDNRYKVEVGVNSHSVSDHTQGNWNGITGQIKLQAYAQVHIAEIKTFPDIKNKSVLVKMKINNTGKKMQEGSLQLIAVLGKQSRAESFKVKLEKGEQEISQTLILGEDALLWSEFEPNVYQLTCSLKTDTGTDEKQTHFGLREFKAQGTQFAINGTPTFLRGTLECCIFPLTGYPPSDNASWARIYRIAKSFGLNHIRFHSYCPPEAAFAEADKAGFYLGIESASWAAQGSTLGDGRNIDQYLYDESERIVREYGNHPSFCLMPYGNEPDGKNSAIFLSGFVSYWKSKDPRRLYTSGSGWPVIPENDYVSNQVARIQQWNEKQEYILNSQAPSTNYDWGATITKYNKPYLSHEIGQWCVFPNLKEKSKYTGVMKARNFELFEEDLAENGMADKAQDFLMASGKLQVLCYKAEIEAALRTKGQAGFQLLDLHDFPGQGTALVGVLDPFWETKGYTDSAEYKRFCNQTVLLARMDKLIFTTAENFSAKAEIAHFGKEPLKNAVISWNLCNKSGKILKSGTLSARQIGIGNGIGLGAVSCALQGFEAPAKYTFSLKLEGSKIENSWEIFVYPQQLPKAGTSGVYFCNSLDAKALAELKAGGKVCLNLYGKIPAEKKVNMGFTPTFWNTLWFNNQPVHTLGLWCDTLSSAFAHFPTDYYTNYQWWCIISSSQAITLPPLSNVKPIVQVIDTWHKNRKLALLFEAKVGDGKLLVCSTDFSGPQMQSPEGKQYFFSLVSYMQSAKFNPTSEITVSQVNDLTCKKIENN